MASFDDDDDDDVFHMRRFKCIGVEDETPRQEFLGVVEREMHEENVPVKARRRPEPKEENERDAIATDKDHGTSWFCVGYIAKNLQSICTLSSKKTNWWRQLSSTLILASILSALAFISQ